MGAHLVEGRFWHLDNVRAAKVRPLEVLAKVSGSEQANSVILQNGDMSVNDD